MEAQMYFQGGHSSSGASQFEMEKQGKGNGDHFIVEDLLDLSNKEEGAGEDGGSDMAAGLSSGCSSTVTAVESSNKSSTAIADNDYSTELVGSSLAGAGLSEDICEPYADLAELEWLSNFVEESFSNEDMHKLDVISGIKSTSTSSSTSLGDDSTSAYATVTGAAGQSSEILPETPRGKARSKRSRVTGPCNWSSGILLLSPTTASSSSDSDRFVIQTKPVKKKNPSKSAATEPPEPAPDGRKCLHCATDKTPQWRTGPMGPKTLCNACGVRFKSGRLVPEYRPAASPTFVLSKHSNSHRKVLELRRQKELGQRQLFLAGASSGAGAGCFYDGSAAAAAGDDFLIHNHLGPDFRQLI